MMKVTTIVTYWNNQDQLCEIRESTGSLEGLFHKFKLVLRHFIISTKQKKDFGFTGESERQIKDEYYHGYAANRIPRKTWKRHSAFIVYGHLVHRQQSNNNKIDNLVETYNEDKASNNELTYTAARMSFKIKSISRLPVWATALSEMTLIKDDVSTLSTMDVKRHEIDNNVAIAA